MVVDGAAIGLNRRYDDDQFAADGTYSGSGVQQRSGFLHSPGEHGLSGDDGNHADGCICRRAGSSVLRRCLKSPPSRSAEGLRLSAIAKRRDFRGKRRQPGAVTGAVEVDESLDNSGKPRRAEPGRLHNRVQSDGTIAVRRLHTGGEATG
jgi:hypothetical protein